MASATKSTDDISRPGQEGGSPPARSGGGGFFSIYKPGQGKWTRLGTVGGAGLIAVLSVKFLWEQLPSWISYLQANRNVLLGIVGVFGLAAALVIFRVVNALRPAEFLIATDSEMKRVNWTSRKELWGSTRVVIFFMFMIAIILFAVDIVFGYAFHLLGVLHSAPF